MALAAAEMETDRNALTYDTKWTPVKRLHAMRDSMPEEARSSVAWTGTLPLPSEPTLDMEEAAMSCDDDPCDESNGANDVPC